MRYESINGIYVSVKQEIMNLETIYLKRVLSSCMFM